MRSADALDIAVGEPPRSVPAEGAPPVRPDASALDRALRRTAIVLMTLTALALGVSAVRLASTAPEASSASPSTHPETPGASKP